MAPQILWGYFDPRSKPIFPSIDSVMKGWNPGNIYQLLSELERDKYFGVVSSLYQLVNADVRETPLSERHNNTNPVSTAVQFTLPAFCNLNSLHVSLAGGYILKSHYC